MDIVNTLDLVSDMDDWINQFVSIT